MNSRYLLVFIICLFAVLTTTVFSQPFVIESATVRGKGANEVRFMRPGAAFDDWWYDDMVECIHDVGCVDIVFCVDTSGSMAGTINSLQDEIDRFAYDIAAVGFDYAFGYMLYSETLSFPHGYDLITDLATFSALLDEARSGDGGYEHHSDAIYESIGNFHWRAGCEQVVILITDECDDASTVTPATTISSIRSWGGTVYVMSADCGDVDDFRDYCDTSYGAWFDYSTSTLTDIFDQIVDDIADIVEIDITITNTSGSTLNPVVAELVPDFCIAVGDSPNPQSYGPIANGASHTYLWDITEIPGCTGWGDCFIIRVSSGGYVDSLVGCLFVEDCGCPGPEARFICPEVSGLWTACQDQYIEIEYTGYIGVDPNTLCIRVEGTTYCYPSSPNLTWTPGVRGGRLRFTPSAPGWSHLQEVNVACLSGQDATGCPQLFFPETDFQVDIHPPKPVWWEHFPATWIPPSPARREARDGSVSWYPPCGSTLDSTDHIIIGALLYDDGVGMTPLDAILADFDATELGSLDFMGLWSSLTSIQITVNDIPFIPGAPIPGHFSRQVDLDYMTYLLDPDSWFGGWAVACTIRADSAGILGLAFLTGEIEVCLKAHDLVEAEGCMPCENDTEWCCTYYIAGDLPLIADAGPDKYICLGTSTTIGGTPPAGGGVEPYTYSWSPATGLSNPNIGNPTASPTTTTTYVLTVTDDASSVDRDTMTVYVSDPVADAGPDTTLCPGGSARIGGSPTASGGFGTYTYSWSPSSSLSDPSIANPWFTSSPSWGDTSITYTVTITDSLGCIATDMVTITIARIAVNAGADRRICLGVSTTLGGSPTASGGIGPYTYSWTANPPGTVISGEANPVVTPTDTTTYIITVTGGSPYCTSYDTVVVYPVQPVADAGRDTVVCSGEPIYIGGSPTASGSVPPYTYIWSTIPPGFSSLDPNPSISPNSTTMYVVQVTDSIGCVDYDSVLVEVSASPYGWVVRPFPCGLISSCEYQSIIWDVVDSTTAIDLSSIELVIDGMMLGYTSPGVTVTTFGDTTRIEYIPAVPWTHGSTVRFELAYIANLTGCYTSVAECNFIVDIEPPMPDPPVPPDGSVLFSTPDSIGVYISDAPAGVDPASFDHITIEVNGLPATGWTYSWSGGYLSFPGLSVNSGDSVVICLENLYDAPTYDYCPPNDTSFCWWFMILPCDLEIAAFPDTLLCGGGNVALGVDITGGSGFLTYSWSPATGLSSTTIPNPTAIIDSSINYIVTVYDESLACSQRDTVTIIVSDPAANAGPDGLICPFNAVPLGCVPAATGGFEPYSYEWFDLVGSLLYSEEHPSHSFGATGESFVLHVTDSLGCEAWDTVTFTIGFEEMTSLDLITPAPGETLAVGGVYFEWSVSPSGGYLYDFILDGTIIFSRIDSSHVTVDFPCGESHFWEILAYNECFETYVSCGETTTTVFIDTALSGNPIFYTAECTEPYAVEVHVPDGDWTACDPDSIVAFIIDSAGIVESTISMTVNGVRYHTSDPELSWDGDSTLVFQPSPMWADGEAVEVCVDSAINIDGVPLIAPVCWEFYIDRSEPEIISVSPARGAEISPTTDLINICLRDILSGLDSISILVDGAPYLFGPFGCVDTTVCVEIPLATPLTPGDTIQVEIVRATDCPDWCGPNVLTDNWILIVSSCAINAVAAPETSLCSPDSIDFSAVVTGGSGFYSYHWTPESIFDDPFAANPTGWVGATGWAKVVVTDDSLFCSEQDSVRLVLSALAIDAGPDGRLCPGTTLNLGCVPEAIGGIEPYSYSWRVLGGAVFSTEANPSYTFGTSSVSLVLEVTDAIGCVETDTVNYTIDYVPITGITLLTPTDGAIEVPGDVHFQWTPIPAGVSATYELYLDSSLIAILDSTDYWVEMSCDEFHTWHVIGYTDCAETYINCMDTAINTFSADTAMAPAVLFATSPCGVPSATYLHVPDGDWTACDPDSIIWRVVDSVGVDPSTFVIRVNGTRYTEASPEVTWTPGSPASRLRFIPSPMWPSGTTVNACLDSVMNLDSVWLPAPVCGEFYVDLDPPVFWDIYPAPGATVVAAGWTTLDLKVFDYLSGLNESTMLFIIDGISFTLASPELSWDGDSIVSIDITGLGIDCGDTVNGYITASDSPDWCAPNSMSDTFSIYTAPCGLTPMIIEPLPNTISACEDQGIILSISVVDSICPIDPASIVLRVEGVDYDLTDAELDWADPILTWTPPADWAHGTVVDVCLNAVEDTCGGGSSAIPLCWSFRMDLEPPIPTTWEPPCDSRIDRDSGAVFNIVLEDGPALIESVLVSIDGVFYPLGSALTISGTTAEFNWNPVLDGGLALSPGQVFTFCVHTGDSGIAYCAPHETLYCCDYTVPTDTGIVTAEIIEPLPNTITACDDQRIVMTINGSETPVFGGVLLISRFDSTLGRLNCDGDMCYGILRDSLIARGFELTEIDQSTILTDELLAPYGLLVVGPAVDRVFSYSESAAVYRFVNDSGRSLLSIGLSDEVEHHNSLVSQFGLEHIPPMGPLFYWGEITGPVVHPHPITEGVDRLSVGGTPFIEVYDGACLALHNDSCIVAVSGDAGTGRVVLLADDQSFMDSHRSDVNIGLHDNLRLGLNIFDWLNTSSTTSICPIDPSSIILRVDGADYTVADGELVWSPDSLIFTPSVLWSSGDTVDVCLTAANDSCGAVLPAPVCWNFFVDIQPPLLTELDPPCGRPVIPGMTDNWSITLTDDVAGLLPDATMITVDGVECYIIGPSTIRQRSFSFDWSPSDCGIALIPGDTITLCILTSDGPVDYCDPNDTIYCCDYPVIDTGGPVGTIIRVPEDSISACDPESIIVEIVSAYPVVESTIVLAVDGTSYRTTSPRLDWFDPFLVFNPDPDWNDHDTVYASLTAAEDIFGNPCQNAPLSWIFYIDRVEPTSSMIEPTSSYTRNLRQQILIDVRDQLAGVDPTTVVLIIDGEQYLYGDFEWLPEGLGGKIRWVPNSHGVEFHAGDTINISLSVGDAPDLCGPNVHLADYVFLVEPWTPCLVVPNPFTPTGDNINEITIFDWPNMTTEGATIYIFTMRNVLVRQYDLPAQLDYDDVVGRAWDGKDSNGLQMPQGLYLYVVESDGRIVCNGTITLLR